jgi:hypothetical protein
MFDVFYWGPKPGLFAFEQPATSLEDAANQSRTSHYWYIYGGNDYTGFDFDYIPVPWETTHIHAFPSQWQKDGGVYLANKNTVSNREWHFRTEQQVRRLPNLKPWYVPKNIDINQFDFSWHPDPHEPDYERHFPTQWQSSGGPIWEGGSGVKLVDDQVALALPTHTNWQIPEEVNANAVDFSWHPNPLDPPYIYHFGTDWQQSVGLIYTVPGATEIKFAGTIPGTENALEVLDIFYVDRGNDTAQSRFELLQAKHPRAVKVRYANTILDTITRCSNKSTTNKFWVISSEYDYTDFDFAWHAQPWQAFMTHVFPSQHQKWSDTFLINKWEFNRHTEWAKTLEEFPNLNFVTDQTVRKSDSNFNIYYVDHGNPESIEQYKTIRDSMQADVVKTRFVDNYLDTFKRIMATTTTEYVWIINSICDYTNFDFTWEPEPWQREMIHCFISGTQKRGDTFYIHVESFKQQMVELELLDWFNVINYCDEQRVERFEIPTVVYKEDQLINAIKEHNFNTPYVHFTNIPDLSIVNWHCLWSQKDRIVSRNNWDGSSVLIPRDVKLDLRTQIYDYPYIEPKRTHDTYYLDSQDSDVIFISNGEPMAEDNWLALARICPWAKRSDGVTGREAAYKAAARLSKTPWFYAVFAKTEVLPTFKFDFYPDYFQEPKHYIFHSRNPLNGLEYGAMNINLYNRQLVLDTDPGLDFTLSKVHTVVPECISISRFNTDPWITWRSAFRETMKLQREVVLGAGPEIQHRLKTWCTVAEGENAEWCIQGALDGVEYHNTVNGDYEALKLSFDWAWCQDYYYSKYKTKIW